MNIDPLTIYAKSVMIAKYDSGAVTIVRHTRHNKSTVYTVRMLTTLTTIDKVVQFMCGTETLAYDLARQLRQVIYAEIV